MSRSGVGKGETLNWATKGGNAIGRGPSTDVPVKETKAETSRRELYKKLYRSEFDDELYKEVQLIKALRAQQKRGAYVPTEALILPELAVTDDSNGRPSRNVTTMQSFEVHQSEYLWWPSKVASAPLPWCCSCCCIQLMLLLLTFVPVYHAISVNFGSDGYVVEGDPATTNLQALLAAREAVFARTTTSADDSSTPHVRLLHEQQEQVNLVEVEWPEVEGVDTSVTPHRQLQYDRSSVVDKMVEMINTLLAHMADSLLSMHPAHSSQSVPAESKEQASRMLKNSAGIVPQSNYVDNLRLVFVHKDEHGNLLTPTNLRFIREVERQLVMHRELYSSICFVEPQYVD